MIIDSVYVGFINYKILTKDKSLSLQYKGKMKKVVAGTETRLPATRTRESLSIMPCHFIQNVIQ